ncbi:MAG: hypothetical protein AB1540_09330 [Bdellovibrionota bacterium]
MAFLQKFDSEGQPVRLEPFGPGFYHVAIRYKEQWLHAHPYGGVQLSKSFSDFHLRISEVLEHPDLPELNEKQVEPLLGKAYDPYFEWGQETSFYCSKLVAKLLNLKPVPMYFDPGLWKDYFARLGAAIPEGFGISPDMLYRKLLAKRFDPIKPIPNPCEGLISKNKS